MSVETMKPKNKNRVIITNIILITIVIALAVMPLIVQKNAEFAGADSQAEQAITELNGNYQAWFSPIWEPPSGEIESLLFALQAAVGAGVLGYGLGYLRGRKKKEEPVNNDLHR
ncbi:energy-coupling factor ABC transporter substrate-binding protein [Dehalobacter sp. FTH1]|uniref:energy-coupling factor ABC transporter substrate-binding protein n=1 Tax=Dehalobacter sp. TBBPA1 TaxID=3235037 RepID=UPI0003600323